uniref:NF-kappa-B inhibitor-like protein 1 n=1 Tax=Rhizochromulina marina TaxID=1034831 RepID=A0A7S2SU33_9STRA|mmetsp:Transcript_708/g.2256  ORF Transcript_708/g.2256 Transcript_708/m.2256 type:complete len:496 (+) Transcript_708:102-1589(+)
MKRKRKSQHHGGEDSSRERLQRRLRKLATLIRLGADEAQVNRKLSKVLKAASSHPAAPGSPSEQHGDHSAESRVLNLMVSEALENCLYVAAATGNLSAASILLRPSKRMAKLGIRIDVNRLHPETGSTALHSACMLQDGALAALLLRHGADSSRKDLHQETPVDLGLEELITAHENSILEAEAARRQHEQEQRQMEALKQERELARKNWQDKLAEASAYDAMDGESQGIWGGGWDSDVEAQAELGRAPGGDWFASIASARLDKLRREEAEAWSRRQAAAAEKYGEKLGAGDTRRRKHGRRKLYGPMQSSSKDERGSKSAASSSSEEEANEKGSEPRRAKSRPHTSPGATDGSWADGGAATGNLAAMRHYTRSQARTADSAAWEAFVHLYSAEDSGGAGDVDEGTRPRISEDSVPWPSAGDSDPLALTRPVDGPEQDARATSGEVKLLVRALLRRWHPDKFVPKWQAFLEPEARDTILRRVNRVAQALNEALVGAR